MNNQTQNKIVLDIKTAFQQFNKFADDHNQQNQLTRGKQGYISPSVRNTAKSVLLCYGRALYAEGWLYSAEIIDEQNYDLLPPLKVTNKALAEYADGISTATVKRHREILMQAGFFTKYQFKGTTRPFELTINPAIVFVNKYLNEAQETEKLAETYDKAVQDVINAETENQANQKGLGSKCTLKEVQETIKTNNSTVDKVENHVFSKPSQQAGKQDTIQETPKQGEKKAKKQTKTVENYSKNGEASTNQNNQKNTTAAAAKNQQPQKQYSGEAPTSLVAKYTASLWTLALNTIYQGRTIAATEQLRGKNKIAEIYRRTWFYGTEPDHAKRLEANHRVYCEMLQKANNYLQRNPGNEIKMPATYFDYNVKKGSFFVVAGWFIHDYNKKTTNAAKQAAYRCFLKYKQTPGVAKYNKIIEGLDQRKNPKTVQYFQKMVLAFNTKNQVKI